MRLSVSWKMVASDAEECGTGPASVDTLEITLFETETFVICRVAASMRLHCRENGCAEHHDALLP